MLHFLYDALKFIFDFIFLTVIVKLIVGRWVAEKIMAFLTKQSQRNLAIFQHYWDEARGLGHQHTSVLNCTDGQCSIFKTAS